MAGIEPTSAHYKCVALPLSYTGNNLIIKLRLKTIKLLITPRQNDTEKRLMCQVFEGVNLR